MNNYLEKSKKYKGYHYSELNPHELSYLHERTLKMLKVIIPIFEKNNVRYMICGGTLLGAMTAGKFIPWDDDVDICVFEDDYEKSIDLLRRQIPSWMFVQWYGSEKKYFHGWAKIRDKHSHVYPDISSYSQNGVWVDLYKLTLTKKCLVPYQITKEHLDYLERRYIVGDISEKEKKKRIEENKLFSKLELQKEALSSSVDSEDTFVIWSASKIVVDKKWVFPRKRVLFEGMELFTFNKPECYLINHYGENYNTLPPDDMRRVGINRIDFFESGEPE